MISERKWQRCKGKTSTFDEGIIFEGNLYSSWNYFNVDREMKRGIEHRCGESSGESVKAKSHILARAMKFEAHSIINKYMSLKRNYMKCMHEI